MDGLNFDAYTSYSDHSSPRTPSPNQPIMNFPLKQVIEEPIRLYNEPHHPHHHHSEDSAVGIAPENAGYWSQQPPPSSAPLQFSHSNGSRGSLLQELYEPDVQQHMTPEFSPADPHFVQNDGNWGAQQQQSRQQPHEFPMVRRATFPYVRHDRDDSLPLQQIPQFYPPQHQHQQPQHQHQHSHMHSFRQQPLYHDHPESNQLSNGSPHTPFQQYNDQNIKLEETNSLMGPSQSYYPPPVTAPGPGYPMALSYLSPHSGLPVQHTDDAASKETQYLRRRCFNCHTTEPPSWRRSTLNPGKIVCNKCGLYERTHLRPRPLRFDELRAGNKARKAGKRNLDPKSRGGVAATNGVKKSPAISPTLVKKEPREYGLVRRSSVSSTSSTHSGSGASDWDENVSVYSSGSAPPTSFSSPSGSPYPLSREESSSPRDSALSLNGSSSNGIRLPNAPLSDIVSMGAPGTLSQSPQMYGSPALPPSTPGSVPHTPNLPSHTLNGGSGHASPHMQSARKSHTSPDVFFHQQHDEYFPLQRGSVGPRQHDSPNAQHQELGSPASVHGALAS